MKSLIGLLAGYIFIFTDIGPLLIIGVLLLLVKILTGTEIWTVVLMAQKIFFCGNFDVFFYSKEADMKKSLEMGLAVIGFGAFGCLIVHLLGKKEGAKKKEEEILKDYVTYIPVGEIGKFAMELMEEEGVSEFYPMLVVRPDKYNYLEGPDPDDKNNEDEE